jgi:hypothetical protein
MKIFVKYFLLALLAQPIGLYISAVFGSKFIWEVFYDPIFKQAAHSLRSSGIEIGFAVIPIFIIILAVFSAYAALIAGLITLIQFKKSRL